MTALIKERRPGILVIDSFKALSACAEAAEFRRFLHDFAGQKHPYQSIRLGGGAANRPQLETVEQGALLERSLLQRVSA